VEAGGRLAPATSTPFLISDSLRYAFIHTYKPVLDDAPYRAFATLDEYRAWCETYLPSWLGYGRV